MYIVMINVKGGKVYLKLGDSISSIGFGWVLKFNQATKFTKYSEAKEAVKLAVPKNRISDATILGYN